MSGVLPQDGFIHSIHDSGSKVKLKFDNVTETQQFKRWFGKSKVVNADGTPKAVYHSTDEKFDVLPIQQRHTLSAAQHNNAVGSQWLSVPSDINIADLVNGVKIKNYDTNTHDTYSDADIKFSLKDIAEDNTKRVDGGAVPSASSEEGLAHNINSNNSIPQNTGGVKGNSENSSRTGEHYRLKTNQDMNVYGRNVVDDLNAYNRKRGYGRAYALFAEANQATASACVGVA